LRSRAPAVLSDGRKRRRLRDVPQALDANCGLLLDWNAVDVVGIQNERVLYIHALVRRDRL
jgi:hypothetical protein